MTKCLILSVSKNLERENYVTSSGGIHLVPGMILREKQWLQIKVTWFQCILWTKDRVPVYCEGVRESRGGAWDPLWLSMLTCSHPPLITAVQTSETADRKRTELLKERGKQPDLSRIPMCDVKFTTLGVSKRPHDPYTFLSSSSVMFVVKGFASDLGLFLRCTREWTEGFIPVRQTSYTESCPYSLPIAFWF